MNRNQKCIVSHMHPRFPARVGFFQFFGEGPNEGLAILTLEPVLPQNESGTWFVVNRGDISPTE